MLHQNVTVLLGYQCSGHDKAAYLAEEKYEFVTPDPSIVWNDFGREKEQKSK